MVSFHSSLCPVESGYKLLGMGKMYIYADIHYIGMQLQISTDLHQSYQCNEGFGHEKGGIRGKFSFLMVYKSVTNNIFLNSN